MGVSLRSLNSKISRRRRFENTALCGISQEIPTVSPLFSDGMVLQRGTDVRLWGTSDEPVTVRFLGQTYHAEPDAAGGWCVTFRNLPAGGPHKMTVQDRMLHDVYIGDVWLCAGQSNMQLPMQRARHRYPEEWRHANPCIRQFTVPQRTCFHGPLQNLAGGGWKGAMPDTLEDFSAVGYFFAKELHARYGVPIGLISTAIGGTPIHTWMGREMLAGFPDLQQEADACADDAYVARIQEEDAQAAARFFQDINVSDPGLAGRWQSPDLDDGDWEERPLLAPWEGTGSVWLRKTLDIPAAWVGRPATLFLGTLVDWDAVYVDGERVGTTTYRYPPREYAIPALPAGRCVITVRAISKDGGGFTPGKPYLLSTGDGAINLNGAWRFRRGGHAAPPAPETVFHKKPTALYNGMIAPLHRYAIRGALWYQGETDTPSPARYAEKFEALARGWREGWGYAFPILFVELPHWGEGMDWDALRAEQWESLRVPGTAMAAAYDLGEHNDLHPQGKRDVGERLARCAMRVAYGETLPPSPFEIVGAAP